MNRAAVSCAVRNGAVTFTAGKSTETFGIDELKRIVRIEYGGDLIGPARNSFWIFDLGASAVVAPDCPPHLRRDILPQIKSNGVALVEGSCFAPPRKWSRTRLLLPPDELELKRVSRQELSATLEQLGPMRPVQEFGDEGL